MALDALGRGLRLTAQGGKIKSNQSSSSAIEYAYVHRAKERQSVRRAIIVLLDFSLPDKSLSQKVLKFDAFTARRHLGCLLSPLLVGRTGV
jgi:hypothetical protein